MQFDKRGSFLNEAILSGKLFVFRGCVLYPSFEISQKFKVKDSLILKKNLEAAGKITLKMGIFKNHQTTKPARDFTSDFSGFYFCSKSKQPQRFDQCSLGGILFNPVIMLLLWLCLHILVWTSKHLCREHC